MTTTLAKDSDARVPAADSPTLTAIVVGAGMSGILAGAKLRRAGIEGFVILEKSRSVGGTWFDNRYPGSGCDVPSHLYSFSFRPNPRWSRAFSRQDEILEYFRDTAAKEGLTPHLRLGTTVAGAAFDAVEGLWTVTAEDGRRWRARALIMGLGQLNTPHTPDIPGAETFAGPQFHTARWDETVDLTDKRVAIVGNGASIVQVVPEIVGRVRSLTILQRSAHYIVPRGDFAFSEGRKRLFAAVPAANWLYRMWIYWNLEIRWLAFKTPGGRMSNLIRKGWSELLDAQVRDPDLKAKLTPDYTLGCKRVLVSDDYYPAVGDPKVAVETAAINFVTPAGLALADGRHVDADVLVWGTGFRTGRFIAPIAVTGLDGRTLEQVWANGPAAHRGVTVSGFPNLFILYGPNTNLGHNSIIFMAERQAGYIVRRLKKLLARDLRYLDVRAEAQAADHARVRADMATTVWAAGGCESWYRTADGQVPQNWPRSTMRYWWRMGTNDDAAYRAVGRGPRDDARAETPARALAE